MRKWKRYSRFLRRIWSPALLLLIVLGSGYIVRSPAPTLAVDAISAAMPGE